MMEGATGESSGRNVARRGRERICGEEELSRVFFFLLELFTLNLTFSTRSKKKITLLRGNPSTLFFDPHAPSSAPPSPKEREKAGNSAFFSFIFLQLL